MNFSVFLRAQRSSPGFCLLMPGVFPVHHFRKIGKKRIQKTDGLRERIKRIQILFTLLTIKQCLI